MARGRRRLPDELKALKGNPGKRRLALDKVGRADVQAPRAMPVVTVPEFLTQEREVTIFKRIVEDYLQRRIARAADFNAYARYASYLHRWITCKESLDGKATYFKSESKWGALLRRHPLFKDMLDLERVLQASEDRLGLNPVARQNIMRGLVAMPAALGGLFGEEPPDDGKEQPDDPKAEQQPPAISALGYLQTAGKPH